MKIRPAEPKDAPELVSLAEDVGREPGDFLLTTDAWRAVGEERRYIRAVRDHPDAAVYVAEVDRIVVGRLSLARDSHGASSHVADIGLMVAAQYRRRGIGWALLEQAVSWARGAGVRKLELHVFPWNEPAVRLYETFGFVREGLRVGHYARGREDVDAVLMGYRVGRPADPAA